MADAKLVVLGEFFLDLIFYGLPAPPRLGQEVKTEHFAEMPGGGAATTALVAAALGTSTAVITRVGQDILQSSAWLRFQRSRVNTQACEVTANHLTALTVCASYAGDRMMITRDSINRNFRSLLRRKASQNQVAGAKHLHVACRMAPPRAWAAELRKFRKSSITISTDFGWNPDVLYSPDLPALLRQCDYILPNEQEALAITRVRSVEKAARVLAQYVRTPVIKLGPDGCLAVWNSRLLRAKSARVRPVDATGTGDAFNGGFLHGLLSGWSLEDCLRAGNVCGAVAATSPGGSSKLLSRAALMDRMRRS